MKRKSRIAWNFAPNRSQLGKSAVLNVKSVKVNSYQNGKIRAIKFWHTGGGDPSWNFMWVLTKEIFVPKKNLIMIIAITEPSDSLIWFLKDF